MTDARADDGQAKHAHVTVRQSGECLRSSASDTAASSVSIRPHSAPGAKAAKCRIIMLSLPPPHTSAFPYRPPGESNCVTVAFVTSSSPMSAARWNSRSAMNMLMAGSSRVTI